jgi:hypothetical protein
MHEFIIQSLEVNVFWTALSALGTLAAVVVAISLAFYFRWDHLRNIKSIVRAEIDGNSKLVERISIDDLKLSDQGITQIIPALKKNEMWIDEIDLKLWKQYRYEIAAADPKLYSKYESIYQYAERLIK